MNAARAARIAAFAVIYPVLALLSVYVAIEVTWEAAVQRRVAHAALPLVTALGGTLGALLLLWLGTRATANPRLAAIPVIATVAALMLLSITQALPGGLAQDTLGWLFRLAGVFLLLSTGVYLRGLYLLWLAPPAGDA
ncbi:hypothetical protein [Jannaschia marina]|uniref:hypothetical protein n=1 Tax=Jannaschia marina TaxID=2741674 RepID=UPI0015CB239E|nr:hypothetical protein [Jannaschia marina]